MNDRTIFTNRRSASRRVDPDPCHKMPLDLYHRKRRKSTDRRKGNRTLAEDYYAYASRASATKYPDTSETSPN